MWTNEWRVLLLLVSGTNGQDAPQHIVQLQGQIQQHQPQQFQDMQGILSERDGTASGRDHSETPHDHGSLSSSFQTPENTSGQYSNVYDPPSGGYEAAYDNDYGTPSNAYRAPTSGYGTPSNAYGAPTSGYGSPSNAYGAPTSEYGTPSNAYGAPTSGYGAPLITYNTPTNEYHDPATSYNPPEYETYIEPTGKSAFDPQCVPDSSSSSWSSYCSSSCYIIQCIYLLTLNCHSRPSIVRTVCVSEMTVFFSVHLSMATCLCLPFYVHLRGG